MFRFVLTLCAIFASSAGFAAENPSAVPLLTLDGKPTTLGAHTGKTATVVVFVSFDCPVSNSYVSQLNSLATTHAERGVAVVLVCPTDDKRESVAKAATGFKLTVPVLLDAKKQLAASLKAEITPEAFVLSAKGEVAYRGRIDDGYSARLKKNAVVTSHDLTDALAAVLANNPVKTAKTQAVGCPIDYDTAPQTGTVTFHKHVAPILNAQCVVCHRAGEVGPFALTTYAQAKRWATDIKTYTANRAMPPWMPTSGVAMKGARVLTKDEIATLAAWADGGAPEGDPKDAPKAPQFGDGWRHGKPDLILGASDDFTLGASGNDLYRCFVTPTGLKEDKWIVGYDVRPGNPRVVHHTLHFFDTTGTARGLELAQREKEKNRLVDIGPGYTAAMGVGFVPSVGKSGEAPKFGGLGGWAPGQAPQFVPSGAGWYLPKGSDFIVQTHYHRDGKISTDRTQVGLYFAKGPVEQPWQTLIVNGIKAWERIPAGKANYTARGSIYLHNDAILHNVLPHMHLLGKAVKVTLTAPGEKPVVLVDIPVWDYRWQETYWFMEPIRAKAGTRLDVYATFDNSATNPNNPSKPPRDVNYGEETNDEMLFVFFGATSTTKPWTQIKTYAFPPDDGRATTGPIKGELTPLLESLVGTWDSPLEMKVAGRSIKLTGTEVAAKAFGGTYIRGLATNSADERGTVLLVTFDPAKKVYRSWMYDSLGTEIAWVGVHNEKTNEIAWTADIADGVKGELTWKLQPQGGFRWHMVIGPRDKPLLELTGDRTKKK
jgi:peroxiredoxin